MTLAPLTFTPFTAADVPLLTRWLQAPHVRAFWDDGERDEAAVAANYGLPDSEMTELLMRVGGQPVGFLQTEEVTPGHEFAPWAAPVGESWALDLLIGEEDRTGQDRAWGRRWSGRLPTTGRHSGPGCGGWSSTPTSATCGRAGPTRRRASWLPACWTKAMGTAA